MFDVFNYVPLIFVVILFVMFAASAVRILPEYERGVLFRLGRLAGCIESFMRFCHPALCRGGLRQARLAAALSVRGRRGRNPHTPA